MMSTVITTRIVTVIIARCMEWIAAGRATATRTVTCSRAITAGRATATKGATRVVLDERGRQWGSQELARWLNGLKNQAVSSVAFMLGGPDGLDRSVIESADRVWSLGTLTLPHELARLVVCEQLYRANSVLAGHPYHRE